MSNHQIRDFCNGQWFQVHNKLIDKLGSTLVHFNWRGSMLTEPLGPVGVAVYVLLCRHSNNNTQKCFLRKDTICDRLGIGSKDTVQRALAKLETLNAIVITRSKNTSNNYTLLDPSQWSIQNVDACWKESPEDEADLRTTLSSSKNYSLGTAA